MNRPNHNYIQPSYRPPRPSGGYWGAPPPSIYRPTWIRPVPPPRPPVINYRIPTLGNILGLAFGSFIDAGINTLFRAGYNVLGYANNIVYLGNVNQLGYSWPEATIYYTDGLMSNAQFQYWTTYYSSSRFDSLYATLTNLYGYPAERTVTNGVTAVSWWAGGDTGYITLSYGPGIGSTGLSYYYTTLTYSDYF